MEHFRLWPLLDHFSLPASEQTIHIGDFVYLPSPESQTSPKLIPNGTKVKCRFQSCQRIRHFANGLKVQYETHWAVAEGPHAGSVVVRSLWESPEGRTVLMQDCDKLDLVHAEELCGTQHVPIAIEGTVSVRDTPDGPRNVLSWIERRVPAQLSKPDSQQHEPDPLLEAF